MTKATLVFLAFLGVQEYLEPKVIRVWQDSQGIKVDLGREDFQDKPWRGLKGTEEIMGNQEKKVKPKQLSILGFSVTELFSCS